MRVLATGTDGGISQLLRAIESAVAFGEQANFLLSPELDNKRELLKAAIVKASEWAAEHGDTMIALRKKIIGEKQPVNRLLYRAQVVPTPLWNLTISLNALLGKQLIPNLPPRFESVAILVRISRLLALACLEHHEEVNVSLNISQFYTSIRPGPLRDMFSRMLKGRAEFPAAEGTEAWAEWALEEMMKGTYIKEEKDYENHSPTMAGQIPGTIQAGSAVNAIEPDLLELLEGWNRTITNRPA
jgi:hypothetical protein